MYALGFNIMSKGDEIELEDLKDKDNKNKGKKAEPKSAFTSPAVAVRGGSTLHTFTYPNRLPPFFSQLPKEKLRLLNTF